MKNNQIKVADGKLIIGMILGLLISGLALPKYAQAISYYVTTDGSDSNSGLSEAQAWRTITYAAAQAQAGDTVRIKGGDYGHEHVVIGNSGTAGNPIVFEGYDGIPVMDGQNKEGDGLTITTKDYITIDGIKFVDYSVGILITRANHITINRCVFEENASAGCRLCCGTSEDITFSSNEFYDYDDGESNHQDYGLQLYYAIDVTVTNNYFFGQGHQDVSLKNDVTGAYIADNTFEGFLYTAIYLGQEDDIRSRNALVERNTFGPAPGYRANDAIVIRFIDDVIVRDNLIDGVSHIGIYLLGWDYSDQPIIPTPQNAEIYGNIIINARGSTPAAWIAGLRFVGPFNNWKIYNNVVFNCTKGLFMHEASGSGIFKNNIIYQNDQRVYWYPSDPGNVFFSHDYNNWLPNWSYAGPNSISTDPLFADPTSNDFHLKSQYGRWDGSGWVLDSVISSCIDAGDSSDDYNNELDYPVGQINMGAYGNTTEASLGSAIAAGSIAGIATDEDGVGIEGATVTDGARAATTNTAGEYTLSNVSAATYTITASKPGYLPQSRDNIVVLDGETITVDFQLTKAPDLVGFWLFEDGSGTTAVDSSEYNNDGAISGATWTNDGRFGSALDFDGTVGYVDCGNDSSLNITGEITVMLWVRPAEAGEGGPNAGPIAKAQSGVDSSWQLRYNAPGGGNYMGFKFIGDPEGGTWVSVQQNLSAGEWYHITGIFNGTEIKCYLNGVETDSNNISAIAGGDSRLFIGQDGWGCIFNGTVDEVKIYNRALTPEEIKADYNSVDCPSGYMDCNGLASDGCEVNIMIDLENCGQCGNRCAEGMVCSLGDCMDECGPGTVLQDGICVPVIDDSPKSSGCGCGTIGARKVPMSASLWAFSILLLLIRVRRKVRAGS